MKLNVLVLLSAACGMCLGAMAAESKAQQPRRVFISGYDADAMEPFVTRDGRYLLFNNLNGPTTNTDIHFAARQDDFTWLYRGKVSGIATASLEGCPTMDSAGRMFFVSPRNYPQTLCTIYSGRFRDGLVADVQAVESISRKRPGLVNFDVDVSPDGTTLVFVDSRFLPLVGPLFADLVIAQWDGTRFTRAPDSARILTQVNTVSLEYAPTISSDKRTLYFTRFSRIFGFKGPQIFRAVRPSLSAPFGKPEHVEGLGEFVEGTALSPDERLLYFHRKDGKRFNLYAVPVR